MAKRRHGQEAELPFVALMDTMTNVVGVLTIVLVMIGISIAHAVKKILTDLPPATEEQIEQVEVSISKARAEVALQTSQVASISSLPNQGDINAELIRLESQAKEKNIKLFDLSTLNKELTAKSSELNKNETLLEDLISERDKLKALLDDTPVAKAPEAKVIRIPNSRPIPEDATIYHAMVKGDRVHIIDPHTPLTLFNRELEKKKDEWLIKRIQVKGKPDKFLYDGTKIVAHFKNFNWGNSRGQTISIQAEPTNYFLWLVIRPDLASGGTPLEEIAQPNSEFVKSLPIIRKGFRSVLMYRVHTDSFDTYLAAREVSEVANIAAGWDINFSLDYRMPIPDVTVERLKEPPPKPPNAPASPPRPKQGLD